MSEHPGGPLGWWSRVGPVKRVVAVVVGLVVVVNLALAALDSVVGSDPGGPAGSSYATADDGVAAWSDLLRARGTDVRPLRQPLGEATLPEGGTVVIVGPADPPTEDAVVALAEHLAAGGRVVAVGATGATYAGALLGTDLEWTDGGVERPEVVGPLLAGLADLRGDGAGSFGTAGPATVEAGPSAQPLVISSAGLVAVADPTLVDNAGLAQGDNAGLAVVLAGPGPVAFAEAEHGYGAPRGVEAIPWSWRLVIAGMVLAALVWFWSVGQRLGPAEVTDRELAPARRAYVDAVAAGLSRTPDPPRPPSPRGDP